MSEFPLDFPPTPDSIFTSEGDPVLFVIDDEPAVLRSLSRSLRAVGYEVFEFERPLGALSAMTEKRPNLVISDLHMPELSGVELTKKALETDPDLAVLILTGRSTVDSLRDSLRLGVVDYLEKPVENVELFRATAKALRRRSERIFHRESQAWMRRELAAREAALEDREEELRSRSVDILRTLMGLMEARNPYFKGHSEAVSRVAVSVAREMRLPPDLVEEIRAGGLLHDIGMVAVPESIMNKDGDLTGRELAYVHEHCRLGERILRPLRHLRMTLDCVLHHHERLDGTGYPDRLVGDAISIPAQIVGLAEAFVAMGEERSFRGSLDVQASIALLQQHREAWFSGALVDALRIAAEKGFPD